MSLNFCPNCGEELPENTTSPEKNESDSLDVEIDYEYSSDMSLEEAIENLIKADQETIDAMRDGPAKAEALRIRKMAEKMKE